MKKIFTLLLLATVSLGSSVLAQNELFISAYVEGQFNNRALEIYNPSDAAIDLSEYMVGRFSNGAGAASEFRGVGLPAFDLPSMETFVIVLDKRDRSESATCLEEPLWNGFVLIDTLRDVDTDTVVLNDDGDVVFWPQFGPVTCADGSSGIGTLYGDEYREEYDLEGKGDFFACPVYAQNNAMYFNGNDAVCLVKGSSVETDFSNVIDVIGVIGENPETTISEPAWVNEEGFWVTRDRSLVRKPEITSGRVATFDSSDEYPDTFDGSEWISYPRNTFIVLGTHPFEMPMDTMPIDTMMMDTSMMNISSIQEFTNLVNIYPNPVNGKHINIESTQQIDKVVLMSVGGQIILAQDLSNPQNNYRLQIEDVASGLYLLELTSVDNVKTFRKVRIN